MLKFFFFTAASLHGENDDMPLFRGLLVQARLVSDDTTTVGTFAVNPSSSGTSELSACSPAYVSETNFYCNQNTIDSIWLSLV